MKSVAISTFKAQCLALLEDVARTGKPLLVTKRGKPLARLTAADHSRSSSPQDTLRHSVETLGDVIAPAIPATAWDATRGVLLTTRHEGGTVRTSRRRPTPRRSRR
jgi:prevent-host-death family protein